MYGHYYESRRGKATLGTVAILWLWRMMRLRCTHRSTTKPLLSLLVPRKAESAWAMQSYGPHTLYIGAHISHRAVLGTGINVLQWPVPFFRRKSLTKDTVHCWTKKWDDFWCARLILSRIFRRPHEWFVVLGFSCSLLCLVGKCY